MLHCSCLAMFHLSSSLPLPPPHAHIKVRFPNVIFRALQNVICNQASFHSPLLALGDTYGAL